MTPDVVVIGAGIVGAACAWRLAQDGRRVLVLEAEIPAGGATAAGMGHIVVMDDSEAQFALTRYSRELWDGLARELPRNVERVVAGTLWVAADEEEMDAVRSKHRFYTSRGVAAEILDGRAVAEAEPNLRPGLAGGLRIPGDSVVYPPVAGAWMLERAVERGATVRRGARVVSIEGNRARLENGEEIDTPVIVIAAGVWSATLMNGLMGGLAAGLTVRGRKGHLVITDRYPGFCRHQIVELGYLKSAHVHGSLTDGGGAAAGSVAFNIQPRATGQMLIGSSRQYGRDDAAVEPEMLARMLRRAAEYMPRITELRCIRAWTGQRPATPDSLPIIGRHPLNPAVWLATGHEGLGITTSLGTGQMLADLVAGRAPAIDAGAFAPGRVVGG